MKPARSSLLLSLAGLSLLAVLPGCDQSESANPPALMAVTDRPLPGTVEIETVCRLQPHQATQLAVTSKSVFVLQSDGAASSVVEVVNGSARPTGLDADRIAKSMSLPKAHGQITAIAADGDRLAFCFAGISAQTPIVAVGTFNPATGDVFTTVDAFSIEAVDPEFITSRVRPSLFVAGEFAWVVRVEKGAVRMIAIRNLRALQPVVSFKTIELGPIQDAITQSAWDFSPALNPGTFYLTDTASRWIRTIDASGAVRHVARFDDTISSISPAALDAAGRVMVLASDRDGVNNTLLVQNDAAFRSLPATGFQAPALDPKQLRIERLVAIPGKPNQYMAYDGTTGNIVRMTLR